MKKLIIALCCLGAAALMASCASSKNAAPIASLDGEWNIIEIENTAVVPPKDTKFPYLGFQTADGQLYGTAGCNRLIGRFDTDAKSGSLDLGNIGLTRMLCADMTLERKVMAALGRVKRYKVLSEDLVALYGSSKKPLVVLRRRAGD
ncbi:MAG: META domain-containing protein [Prevotellaceae bacterium]|nr:META domain-containing protein [Prevotellaceae bacterium]